jgi:proteic killer suppression protein
VIDENSIRHKGLKEFYTRGVSKRVPQALSKRIANRLAALEAAREIGDLNTPSLRVHQLAGKRRGTWSIWVSGPWRMTFRFERDTVYDLDLEQYH